MLTKFQFDYLQNIVEEGIDGQQIDTVIFAITSANHENTRRNPVPLYLRTLAIDKFSKGLSCKVKIYPINDVKHTSMFADYMLRQIFYQWGKEITSHNTVLACSTPSVISMFRDLDFKNIPVELLDAEKDSYQSLRPYEVVDLLVKAGDRWEDPSAEWRKYASEATQEVYHEYDLGNSVIELFKDALLSGDADITDTRDYLSYASGMDSVIDMKFNDIKPFVKEGKIVDVGCSTGSLIKLLAKEFHESDIIGIEAARKFYEHAKSQEYESPLVFFYRRNITDQNFKENSINTFIYSSVMHELYSYIGEEMLAKIIGDAHSQLVDGGRLVIRDVVGPNNPDKIIYMALNQNDGSSKGDISSLSTYSKFFHFVKDFKPRQIKYKEELIDGKKLIKLSLRDAYEYLSKMTYTDNWESEMHEEFGFYSFEIWKEKLRQAGFKIVAGSKEFKNPYIISKKYKDRAVLYGLKNGKLYQRTYPSTNMILVGEK